MIVIDQAGGQRAANWLLTFNRAQSGAVAICVSLADRKSSQSSSETADSMLVWDGAVRRKDESQSRFPEKQHQVLLHGRF
jgi:hypothetical protein